MAAAPRSFASARSGMAVRKPSESAARSSRSPVRSGRWLCDECWQVEEPAQRGTVDPPNEMPLDGLDEGRPGGGKGLVAFGAENAVDGSAVIRVALAHDEEHLMSLPLVGWRGSHIGVCGILVCMGQVDRLSVTMPPEIGAAVREAAARQGTSVSTWLVSAAAQRLRNELLGAALDRWEAEEGPFSDEELDAAAAALGRKVRRGAA